MIATVYPVIGLAFKRLNIKKAETIEVRISAGKLAITSAILASVSASMARKLVTASEDITAVITVIIFLNTVPTLCANFPTEVKRLLMAFLNSSLFFRAGIIPLVNIAKNVVKSGLVLNNFKKLVAKPFTFLSIP